MKVLLLLNFIVSVSGFQIGGVANNNIFDVISRFQAFQVGGPTREQLKTDLLKLCKDTNKGLTATPDQKSEINDLFSKLEKVNPTKKSLSSDLVNGIWSMEYTTSDSILGKGGFPRIGPILQTIDTATMSAENSEVVNYFGAKVPRTVVSEISPQSDTLVNVQFKRFTLGPIGFDAPEKLRGFLDITYLDENLRLSRGDKGNLFILTRYQ